MDEVGGVGETAVASIELGNQQGQSGWLYGIAAYGIWGAIPLYFHQLGDVPPLEVLFHRICWSAGLLILLISLTRNWTALYNCISTRKTCLQLLLSTIFIALNWYGFIYSITSGQAMQGSLGYFILPIVNAMFGILFFAERVRPAQIFALGMASLAIGVFILYLGTFPWIAITVAFSFAIYGLIRKKIAIDPMIGLSVETLLMTPISLGILLWWNHENQLVFGHRSRSLDFWIALSGLVTTLPLLLYARALQSLQLISIGFLQYISPTCTLLIAIFIFEEEFSVAKQIAFLLIWIGLSIVIIDTLRTKRKRRMAN